MSSIRPIGRVLIANRGEVALRIARTLREMDIESVAIYSDVDRLAPHVQAADFAFCLGAGPAHENYLNQEKILAVCREGQIDGIHPGYGFLSENADFAEAVCAAGIVWIGPPPEAMRTMGSKTQARSAALKARVSCVPGSQGLLDEATAQEVAAKVGYPVMLKASAGGGGKGMRFVANKELLLESLRAARSEALNAFGDETVYLEKAIVAPRHIEIQVFGLASGKVVALGERECSMQRRHQKIIEESPSPAVSKMLRAKMVGEACRLAEAVAYRGAGTVEFLLDAGDNIYFLEMNTRLQVEHPVTEMCWGLDLVRAQIETARGIETHIPSSPRGHAIEVRVYAEDPYCNFLPAPGKVGALVWPQGPGVRVDAGIDEGFVVTQMYDPLLAKIVVWAADRDLARVRMLRALGELSLGNLVTNHSFLTHLLESSSFADGAYTTQTALEELDIFIKRPLQARARDCVLQAAAVDALLRVEQRSKETSAVPSSSGYSPWQLAVR